ncbi:MAG: hypothetical protein RL211_1424 [Pseudomonadota bacterium]
MVQTRYSDYFRPARGQEHKTHKEFLRMLLCVFLSGRGERIRTSGLYVPNVALYQAKLHPEVGLKWR